jgi:hypothetical protein
MKIAGIFRGFPGLGRVVSGVELITHFKDHFNADIQVYSYLQGEKYLNQKGFTTNHSVSEHDFSSIGIIPVSAYGEYIFNQIEDFNPDIVIIDGEPLILQSLRVVYPNLKIVALLNPFDVHNPYNQSSSSLIFNDMYSKANLAIVHGFWKLEKPYKYNEFLSINTIIRKEVLSINPTFSKNKICCILGGGTVNSKIEFQDKSIAIAYKCVQLADVFRDFEIHIFCSNKQIYNEVIKNKKQSNTFIHANIEDCNEYYSDSKLIIARAGRNTISEVLYLGIPTIVIPTGCKFRSKEQKTNAEIIEKISSNKIININEDIDINELINQCKMMLKIENQISAIWVPGNDQAIELILKLYNLAINETK